MDLSPNHPPGVSIRLSSASLQNTCGPQARRSPACPARPHTHAPSRGVPGPSRGLPLPPISGAPLRSFARPWRPLRPPRGRMGSRSGVRDVCCHRAWSHGKAAPRAGRRRSRSPRRGPPSVPRERVRPARTLGPWRTSRVSCSGHLLVAEPPHPMDAGQEHAVAARYRTVASCGHSPAGGCPDTRRRAIPQAALSLPAGASLAAGPPASILPDSS